LPSHDTGGLRPERWRRHGIGMKSHIAVLPCWVLCVVSVGCELDFELKTDMHSDFVFLTLLCQRYQHDMQTGRSDAAWVIHANPTYKAGDAQHGAPDAMGSRFLLVRMSHGSAVPVERVCAHSCRQLVHGTDTCLILFGPTTEKVRAPWWKASMPARPSKRSTRHQHSGIGTSDMFRRTQGSGRTMLTTQRGRCGC
jgi:hypothetical protein